MTEFRYLTAAEWGGTWTTSSPPVEKLPDGELFVHHVGGSGWMGGIPGAGEAKSRAAACAVFYNLNEYAKRPKADGGKGYQFLDYDSLCWFDRFNDIGWIAEGRGKYRSAATLDRNEEGEAVCACGNYSLRAPLDAEVEMIARACVFTAEQGWTTRDPLILGHRDNPAHPGATGCPGDFLYPRLPEIRALFTALMTPDPPEDDMARLPKVRVRTRAKQWALLPLSAETNRELDIEGEAPFVLDLTAQQIAGLEAHLGYQLAPTKDGS